MECGEERVQSNLIRFFGIVKILHQPIAIFASSVRSVSNTVNAMLFNMQVNNYLYAHVSL